MIKLKIGEEVKLLEDVETRTCFRDTPLTINAGSKAIVASNHCIEYVSGNAVGKIQMLNKEQFQVNGYDTENIAKMILNVLNRDYDLEQVMETSGIDTDNLLESIQSELERVLI